LEGEQTELIQAKYHVAPGTLTDASPDLWKTLRVWSEVSASQPAALLVLVTTATAASGSIASLLRVEDRDVHLAHQRLVNVAKSSSSQSMAPAMGAFLGLSDEDRLALVDRILISDAAPRFDDLDERFRSALRLAVPADRRDALALRLREWWLLRAEQHLVAVAQGAHPRVSGTEIEARLGDIRDELSADNLPIDFQELEPPDEEDVDEQRKFVMQLRLIALSRPRVRKAVHDYNRAFHQRSRWLREDLVGFDELRKYEIRLKEEWERLSMPETDEDWEPPDEEAAVRGRSVFMSCEDASVEPIRPRVSAPYVMRGSLHMLADDLRIGWHHDWVERMKTVLEGPPA
jgi:hypothetical protein